MTILKFVYSIYLVNKNVYIKLLFVNYITINSNYYSYFFWFFVYFVLTCLFTENEIHNYPIHQFYIEVPVPITLIQSGQTDKLTTIEF